MRYQWLDEYMMKKKEVTKEYKEEWKVYRFLLREKMIGMLGGDNKGNPILTLKCEPLFGEDLRKKYRDITPGYYMNKTHWNSVRIDGKVPDEVVKQMIDMSYELILKGFSKKIQKEILEQQ